MKKFIFIILSSLFLFSCNQNRKVDSKSTDNDNIDTLLSKSYNFKLDKKVRLYSAVKAYRVLQSRKNDSLTRNYYFKLAGRFYNLEEYEKYLTVSRDVYRMSRESNDTLAMAKSLHYLGDYHYNKFRNDSAYYYFTKAEKTYLYLKNHQNLDLKNSQDLDGLKLYKANILFYEKDFSGSEIAIVNILKTTKQKKRPRLVYDCYITLGNSLEGLNNNEKAIEYYNKAYEITQELKNDPQFSLLRAQAYNYIGRVYTKKESYPKAMVYFEEALDFDDFKKSEPLLYANLTNNIAYTKFKLGNKTALSSLNEALQIRDSLDNIPGIVSSKINLSEYYLTQNDIDKALLFGKEALKMAHDHKIFEDELQTLELLAKIDVKNILFYNDRFIKLTDSLQNNERATQNKFARIEYETDEILNQKNNIEAEKNKISNQRWLILGSSLFVLLFIIISYIALMQRTKNKELQFEKNQQKANEEIYQLMLEQNNKIAEGRQNEKKRISQELHDGVMSKLTSTRLNLFILSKKTDEETIKKCLVHIAEIQNIEKEIRSISHDLSKDIFSGKDSFETIIESLFEEQKNISDVEFNFEADPSINWETIESATKMHLYRIFQETLQNIHKYAGAKHVSAIIKQEENNIYVEINDDGVGFNVNKTKEGIGLKNMQSRIKMINGTINIKSAKGKGTQIALFFPK